MSLLFHTNKDHSAILHPDCIKLCPGLSHLKEQELLFIILYADYNSPLKQYPDRERRRRAMWQAFSENEDEFIDSAYMQQAIEDYRSLQYNPTIETSRIYQQKIDNLHDKLLVEEKPSEMKKIGEAIDDLRKRIEGLQSDYTKDQQKQGVIKGDKTLSYLEKLQANQKLYLSLQK